MIRIIRSGVMSFWLASAMLIAIAPLAPPVHAQDVPPVEVGDEPPTTEGTLSAPVRVAAPAVGEEKGGFDLSAFFNYLLQGLAALAVAGVSAAWAWAARKMGLSKEVEAKVADTLNDLHMTAMVRDAFQGGLKLVLKAMDKTEEDLQHASTRIEALDNTLLWLAEQYDENFMNWIGPNDTIRRKWLMQFLPPEALAATIAPAQRKKAARVAKATTPPGPPRPSVPPAHQPVG